MKRLLMFLPMLALFVPLFASCQQGQTAEVQPWPEPAMVFHHQSATFYEFSWKQRECVYAYKVGLWCK